MSQCEARDKGRDLECGIEVTWTWRVELKVHGLGSVELKGHVTSAYLVDFGPLAGEAVPQDDGAFVVAAGQKVLVITAPADTAAGGGVRVHHQGEES